MPHDPIHLSAVYGDDSEGTERDRAKRIAEVELERLLREGLNSGPPIEIDSDYFKRKREDLRTRRSTLRKL